ncbi:MAG: hypothetical protein QOE00_1478 [Ilumatobacteraceae bacterium]|jgi:hypothetical protein
MRSRGYSVRPLSTVHAVQYDRHVLVAGMIVLLIGFAFVVPRGGVAGSAAGRNVMLGSQRMLTTRGYDGLPSRRYRVIQVLAGLVLIAAGIALIAASG